MPAPGKDVGEQQDQKHDQQDRDNSTGPVTESLPGWDRSQQKQDQDDKQNRSHVTSQFVEGVAD